MSYLVLARKHRPISFDELIGQEHISDILKKSITSGRIAHAYLFCGPRGVGKTSCARILAQCLNCQDGPKINPPADDPIVESIAKGNSFDVLEIDGASNRGIDEIRMLRENVKFAPSAGKYKIYIVDEVHMLTTEAFNALLKTLEEPPEHVKFIFATTEPQKLPATIISRCQKFDFKRINIKTISSVLEGVCKKEKIKIGDDAIYAIAKAAKGSMRDGLSILDQLSAMGDKGIKADDVFSMLGLVETDLVFAFADALARRDSAGALDALESIIDKGKDVKQLNKDLVDHFRHLMVIKVGGKKLGKLVDYPIAIKEELLKQSEYFQLNEILNIIDVFIKVQDTARITENYRIPLEIAIAKVTYSGEAAPVVPPPASSAPKPTVPKSRSVADKAVELLKDKKGEAKSGAPEMKKTKEVSTPQPPKVQSTDSDLTIEQIVQGWDAFTHELSQTRMLMATYLQEAKPYGFTDGKLAIGFTKDFIFNKEALEDQENIKDVSNELTRFFGGNVAIEYHLVDEDMKLAAEEDTEVKSVMDAFGGEVVSKWHKEE